jgi:hypothetical protein
LAVFVYAISPNLQTCSTEGLNSVHHIHIITSTASQAVRTRSAVEGVCTCVARQGVVKSTAFEVFDIL